MIATRRIFATALLGTLWHPSTTPAATASGATKPMRFGAYTGAGCTGSAETGAFERLIGRPVDIVIDFLAYDTWEGMIGACGWATGCWKAAGHKDLVVSVAMLVKAGAPTLAQGAAGQFDQHYRDLARKLIENGYGNCVVRIGWEFNGDWYPWTARGHTEDFKGCWRRIALAMRSVPGAHFRFDWCAATIEGPTAEAYPGDDVVDIIGLDVYDQSYPQITDHARRWQFLLTRPNGLNWHRDFAQAHNKPRSFPEWGAGSRPDGHGGGDDPLYIRNILAWFKEGGPVDYACYWDYRAPDFDAKLSDGRLPRSAEALRDGLRG